MNQQWQTFLQTIGFVGLNTSHSDSEIGGSRALLTNSDVALVEASDLAVIHVSGEDAFDFFQAQICNDLSMVQADSAQTNGYCNPKGRLLALFTVVKVEAGFLVILPREMAQGFIKRLSMFVLRAKVSVAEREDLMVSAVIASQHSAVSTLAKLHDLNALPHTAMGAVTLNSQSDVERILINFPTHGESDKARFLFIGPVSAHIDFWQHCQQHFAEDACALVTYDTWRACDITSAQASVVTQTHEQFIPQMVNLQLTGGVSFKKGCYPGQEIVARVQYLGKLKRHMRRFSVELNQLPTPGASVASADDQNAGIIVDAIPRSCSVEQGVFTSSEFAQNTVDLLVVVKMDKPIDSFRIDGAVLTSEPMPYDFVELG
ncbi:MAG: hypothetical protein KTR35_12870 [Gammaproteobacteria bacterium]|nr:hypothetical protein [Gammaproteobacteria bacterium]